MKSDRNYECVAKTELPDDVSITITHHTDGSVSLTVGSWEDGMKAVSLLRAMATELEVKANLVRAQREASAVKS